MQNRRGAIQDLCSRLVVLAALAMPLVGPTAAHAYPSLGGVMAHSRDDISGFTSLTGDNAVATATIPFSVRIDGVDYNSVAISTNGWMEFGGNTAGDSDPTNDCLPTSAHTNPFLAFYWDDMRTINTAIRYGTVGTAPGRVFIVDVDLETVAGPSHDVTMQVQVHEGSNLITLKYDDTQSESSGQAATIGWQGAGGAGATARPLVCNGRILDDNTIVDAWSIDLGLPQGSALAGVKAESRDDISGFTTLSGNDSVATASIPFNVTIDGVSYNSVAISTNGWLEFGGNTAGDSDPSNDCLPTAAHTNPFLAAYWDDMRTINEHIRYGTVGQSPNRTFVVDFRVENNNTNNHDVVFQVQVHERSNLITTKYLSSQNEANGQTATIGWQSAGGASATARPLGCNAKVLDDNLPDEGWSIDLGSPRGSALHGVIAHSPDDLPGGFATLSGNDSVATANLGFTLTLEGQTYTTVAVSTNGWLEFGGNTAGDSDPSNDCLPTAAHTNPFLAAYWDDMRTINSAIRYGTVGSAGGRVFIADFQLENNNAANHDLLMQVQVHERSNTIIVKYADTMDQANGQTATIGYQTAGGASAVARSIGCNAKVLDDNTTRGEGWSVSQTEVCGDGLVTAGEQCDLGAANGAATSCCTSSCQFRSAGSTCRASAGVCDVAETCTGSSATCPADAFQPPTTECRAAGGECDVAESCTGTSAACPADAKQPNGTACTDDGNVCTADVCDGSSNACQHPAGNAGTLCRAAADVCDVAEVCDGVSPTCPPDGFAPSTTVCRPSAGECDVADACTGTDAACPADAKQPGGTGCTDDGNVCTADVCDGAGDVCTHPAGNAGAVCRAAAGDCDVAEACDGVSPSCPSDAVATAGTECRAAAGVCDVAESCDGVSAACPADGFLGAGTECRAAAGICDVAETCDGVSAACPADDFVAAGTECRAAAGVCDVAETCDGESAACPADDFVAAGTECRPAAGDCDLPEVCSGSDADCPADSVAGAFIECRPAAGACDVAELCDGVGTACPPDSVAGAFVECRPSAGDCDPAELCDGVGTACPADVKEPATTVCRPSVGACDVAETCDGVSDTCPADAKEPATTVCRAAVGDCDVAETCDGVGDACPADALATSGTVCRPAVDVCDVAETCDGVSTACPADTGEPDGDGDGTCDLADLCPDTPDPSQADADGDGLGDACDPCTNVFNGGAFMTKEKLVATRILAPGGDDKLKLKGFVIVPTTPTIEPDNKGLRLLVQRSDRSVVLDATLPPGAYSTATRAGWKANGPRTKFLYKNAGNAVPLVDGIGKVSLSVSAKTPGLVKFSISGKGGTYGPVASGDLPLVATLVIDVPFATTGQCGESNFAAGGCTLNGPGSSVKCK
jgi:hypothetical protein